jgi:hypothetical protein
MNTLWKILSELLAFGAIMSIAEYHAHLFIANKKINNSFHFWWACAYFIPAFYVALVMFDNWYLLAAFTAERFFFYNPLLNLMRNKTFFYLSTASGNSSSWWDRLEIKWKNIYPDIWVLSGILLITLQFFIFRAT